jgi:hypothetical protein
MGGGRAAQAGVLYIYRGACCTGRGAVYLAAQALYPPSPRDDVTTYSRDAKAIPLQQS